MFDLKLLKTPITQADSDFLLNFRLPNGKRFPRSYRDFASEYGYGLLCGLFLVYVPLGYYCDSWTIQTAVLKQTFNYFIENDAYLTLEPDGSVELIERAVPFGKSENGDFLFWDLDSSSCDDELDIYVTDFGGIGVVKIASSLYDFIDKITDINYSDLPNLLLSNSLPRTFMPIPLAK